MFRLLPAMLALCATACAADGRATALQGLDLGDRATLRAIQEQIPRDQRGALATYALLHWPQSKFYCGRPVGPSGTVPRTVGDAIDMTLAFESDRERALAATRAPANAFDRLVERKQETITRIETLVLQRDMVRAKLGPSAASSAEYRAIAAKLETARADLERVRSQMPAQAALSSAAGQSLPPR